MRGRTEQQPTMFVMINMEARVPSDHPLRAIKKRCAVILKALRQDFDAAYSRIGRPSIPPEQLLKAMLLQALYSIRSEIQLMQAIEFNLLYRWFLDIPGDAVVWTPEVFSMNRERFAKHDLVRKFFDRIVSDAMTEELVSSDHFTADGTLIRSWASLKSLVPKDGKRRTEDDDPGNRTVNFHHEKRTNATHQSATDPDALLARKGKGKEAHLCHSGHVVMENRHGLCLAVGVDAADGHAERRMTKRLLKQLRKRHRLRPKTLGLDAGYDDGAFLVELERCDIVPHVPVRSGEIKATGPPGDARRRALRQKNKKGFQMSQRIRKRVEEIFGWFKGVGGLARTRFVGRWKIELQMLAVAAAYNLLRLARLRPAV